MGRQVRAPLRRESSPPPPRSVIPSVAKWSLAVESSDSPMWKRGNASRSNTHDPPAALGERDRGGAAGRAAADDGDVEIVASRGLVVAVTASAGVRRQRQYTSHAFAMTLDPILRAFADTRARGARRADGALVVSPSAPLERGRPRRVRRARSPSGSLAPASARATPWGSPPCQRPRLPRRLPGAAPGGRRSGALRQRAADPRPAGGARPARGDRVPGFGGGLAGGGLGVGSRSADAGAASGDRPRLGRGQAHVGHRPASRAASRSSAAALLADEAQLAETMGIGGDDRLLAAMPLSHSYGFSSLALPALVRGATLVLPEDGAGLAATASIAPLAPLAAARELAATVFPTVPAWLGGFVRLASAPAWPESLRLVLAAGAPLAPETARDFRRRTAREVHVFYGASEVRRDRLRPRGRSGRARHRRHSGRGRRARDRRRFGPARRALGGGLRALPAGSRRGARRRTVPDRRSRRLGSGHTEHSGRRGRARAR